MSDDQWSDLDKHIVAELAAIKKDVSDIKQRFAGLKVKVGMISTATAAVCVAALKRFWQ